MNTENWIIREGDIEEIEGFQLFNEGNEGDEILVLEVEGKVVAYAQHTGYEQLYFLESEIKGGGSALIEEMKSYSYEIHAHNVEKTAVGFYEKMGFVPQESGWFSYGLKMSWYEEK